MTGSGSVVTSNVPDAALAIGRARQVTKDGLAVKMFEILKAKKKKRDEEA